MGFLRRSNLATSSRDERRNTGGRFRASGLRSTFGPVLDLSISGVAVLSTRSRERLLNSKCEFWLAGEGQERFAFTAEVRSSTKIGFRRHRVGLCFVQLTPTQRMMLTEFGSRAGSHEYGWGKTG